MSKKNLKHAFVGQDSEDTQVKIEKACSLATYNQSRPLLIRAFSQPFKCNIMHEKPNQRHTVLAFCE